VLGISSNNIPNTPRFFRKERLSVLRYVLKNRIGNHNRKTCVNARLIANIILGNFPAFT
jgi:hypothetical protein